MGTLSHTAGFGRPGPPSHTQRRLLACAPSAWRLYMADHSLSDETCPIRGMLPGEAEHPLRSAQPAPAAGPQQVVVLAAVRTRQAKTEAKATAASVAPFA